MSAAPMPVAVPGAVPPARWIIATDSAGVALDRVRDPGVQLAWWQRPVDDLLVAGIRAVPDEALPHLRLVVPSAGVADALRRAAACDGGPLRLLIRDVDELARRFAAITRAAGLLIRLERISGDACRRWHADHVPLRLLCTYRDPTTMLAPPDTVSRTADGAVQADDSSAVQPPCLDVLILKGQRFGDATPPAVHRSPPLAGTGKTRYLLAIDPAGGPD
jgi:hypothetical protein